MIDEARYAPLGLAAERLQGTYSQVEAGGLIDAIARAGLRGRGGAGFPAHIKWRAVAAAASGAVVVANGEEGEPASLKDRWLLTYRPHLVLEGLLLAGRACGAARMIVYLSHEETIHSVKKALSEVLESEIDPCATKIEVHVVAPTYVAGEETSACRSINGGPALPTAKPPRPSDAGVDGLPTLVSNVETLAQAAWISRHGAIAYRQYGSSASPGTTLITLTGDCGRAGVFEVPYGVRLTEAFSLLAGGFRGEVKAVLAGGWFGGVLPASSIELPITFEAWREAGSGLGCGTFTALGGASDPMRIVAQIGRWYARESAAQCGICVKGTKAIAEALQRLSVGKADQQTLSNLNKWGASLRGRGACALLDGATNLARSAYDNFVSTSLASTT
jgi:NADH:ubiquinone oxidoreductase subunit F (NADH-binding)